MRKIFVLMPNSLLSSVDSTQHFGDDNTIAIPMAVIEELQKFKGKPEKRKTAREILEYLETFDARKLVGSGCVQENGSIIRIVSDYEKENAEIEGITSMDKRCFQVCLGLKRDNPGVEVILVSKDPAIRIKAKILGIKAKNFRDDMFPALSEQYTGRKQIIIPNRLIDFFYEKKYLAVETIPDYQKIDWVTNMFVVGKDSDESSKSMLGRFDGEKIVPMRYNNYPSGVKAKNVGQRMLMECLLTDWQDAPLVIAKGGAGTGKTFCSLAVGLEELDNNRAYEKILVASPFETIGQERMGYLPGDIRDKATPYLGGVKDNLAILRGNSKKLTYKEGHCFTENGEYYLENGSVQIQPIGFLRGRTIVNTLFIIDETQNVDPSDIKSIVTRAAEGSKFVFLGDPSQVDNPKLDERYNGLVYLSEKMKGDPLCWQVTLDENESVRGSLARVAAKKL